MSQKLHRNEEMIKSGKTIKHTGGLSIITIKCIPTIDISIDTFMEKSMHERLTVISMHERY